jgi:multidrug efflux pump subunit AcrA (membrane-fusion protein)
MRVSRWSALVLLAVGVGCDQSAPEAPKVDPTDVRVAIPTPRSVTDYEEFTGHTDAFRSVEIKARVTGYLVKKDFLDGQEVNKDDILYEIDDRPYKAALDSAEATAAQAEAHRNRLEKDYKRASNLFQRAAIGKQEFDLISSNFAEAEAQLGASRAQLENAQLNMSFTKVRAPMAGQLSRTLLDPGNLVRQDSTILNDIVSTDKLYAYFDISVDAMDRVSKVIEQGRVGGKDNKEVPVLVGTTVDADRYEDAMGRVRDDANEIRKLEEQKKKASQDAEAKTKKLVEDVEARMKRLAADEETRRQVAEDLEAGKKKIATELEALRKKLELAIETGRKKLAADEKLVPPEFPCQGLVDFSENKLDAATGTLRVRGEIKNTEPNAILPGLFVRIRLPFGEPREELLIPEDSIGSDQGRAFLYVVTSKDEVEYRPIEVGALFPGEAGTKMRVLRKGIEAGERFIQDSDTIRRLRPGARVKVDQGQTQSDQPPHLQAAAATPPTAL